jgi:hypothetical protein
VRAQDGMYMLSVRQFSDWGSSAGSEFVGTGMLDASDVTLRSCIGQGRWRQRRRRWSAC